ncbi:MAG TPA: DUF5947 family protein [Trebonia sp.]|jgi:hypothetical protein|nr:DUF5947 family protein [Trebonia sp.]
MCGEQVPERHAHLVDTEQRSISCACTACGLLFTRPGGRYRTVPDRVRYDPDAPLTGAEWAELGIPVGIAFFFVNSALGHIVASYPSPAGVTECELDLAGWDRLAAAHPLLRAPSPDVEAILVVAGSPRLAGGAPVAAGAGAGGGDGDGGGVEAFLIPIDACYSLAGGLRVHWRGFDGGAEAQRLLTDFLADIRERARPLAPTDPLAPLDPQAGA